MHIDVYTSGTVCEDKEHTEILQKQFLPVLHVHGVPDVCAYFYEASLYLLAVLK